MEGTIEQRVFIVKNYFKFGENLSEVEKEFLTKYGKENCPSDVSIRKIVENFVGTGSVKDEESETHHQSGSSEETATIINNVSENP